MTTDNQTLLDKVTQMRDAQKEFTRTMSSKAKDRATKLEAEVDQIIKSNSAPEQKTQVNLF